MKHRKRRVILISAATVIFLLIAVHFFLDTFFPQRNFALESPIVTEQGDQFNYSYTVSDGFPERFIEYKIYHQEGSRWKSVIEANGEYSYAHGIGFKTVYQDKDILVYRVRKSVKNSMPYYNYLLIEKTKGNQGINLGQKMYDMYHASNEEIRNDAVLNSSRSFFMNYSTSTISNDSFYTDLFNRIERAFEES